MKRTKYHQFSYKTRLYCRLLDYKCAHPSCESGTNVEGHHIYPLSKGGEDTYWNLISLCFDCHRHKKLHSRWDKIDIELFTWKSLLEAETFGFYLDEKQPDFRTNFRRAIIICRQNETQNQRPK